MATYAYIARDPSGRRVEGRLAGATEQTVLSELESRNLAPIDIRHVRERTIMRRRPSRRRLAGAYRQMADLLRAGVPLLRALRLLGSGRSHAGLAAAMGQVADAVADGAHLADAMASYPGVFPAVHVAMIRAGERGGFLEQVFERLGLFVEQQADLRSKIIGNLVYPAFLLTVGLGVVIGALVFFVPRFEAFYARMDLPIPTRILLASSSLVVGSWHLLLLAVVLLVAGLWWMHGQPVWRRHAARWQLRAPVLGPLVRSLAVGRVARLLGTLLNNGIPLLSAMQISRDAVGHVMLEDALDEAIESVRAGETLTKPLADSGMFEQDMIEMIRVGETANNLPAVLTTLADTIEKRIERLLAVLVRMMEPILLLCMAGVVLFIFLALIVPMLRLSTSL